MLEPIMDRVRKARAPRPLLLCAVIFGALGACAPDEDGEHSATERDPVAGDSVDPVESVDDDQQPEAPTPRPGDEPGASGGEADAADSSGSVPAPFSGAFAVPPVPQIEGDAEQGYAYLVNGDYQTLGLPWSGFSATMSELEPRDSLPGRTGDNAKVSYRYNVVTDPDGVKVVAANCLNCHAQHLNGRLIVGLGRADFDSTSSGDSTNILGILVRSNRKERAAAREFASRMELATEHGGTDVFPVLASHHHPETLEWTDEPVFDGNTALVGTVDIPPWWRSKKKNGLYSTGVGRGLQGRHMSFMSVFSVRDAEEGQRIEDNFVNVAEYIRSIEPPAFPGPIDEALADAGEQVFVAVCATCHGTYGEDETYPNLVIPYEEVGTDPMLATDHWVNEATVDWFGKSFYARDGEAWMEQLPGYYAPPLDGVWATAPFFHNASVPTLDAVIDPEKRPKVWRASFGDDDYDLEHVGWTVVSTEPEEGSFDTSEPGNSNQGHTYGANLSAPDQVALLEYLKTL